MVHPMNKREAEQFTEKEAKARFETALRAGLNTQATPHDEMKVGKRKQRASAKQPKSPSSDEQS